MTFVYRLTSTRQSSAVFGPCEVCGRHASEVFIQAEQRPIRLAEGTDSLTYAGCRPHLFGHEACLISKRKAGRDPL